MYKDRKETTHEEIGKEQHTSSYIYENKYNVCQKINGHKTSLQEDNVTKKERKEKYIKSSLHPSRI